MKLRRQRQRGNAQIEFALLVPVMFFLFLGVVNFALAIQQSMVITDAAHAGAEYGALAANSGNLTGMQNAAKKAATGISGLTATATTWCSCSAQGAVVSCSIMCTTYGVPAQYVQVKTSATIPILLPFPGLPSSFTLGGNSVLRIQ